MGRSNKRITTFEQICLIWIMMLIWGGFLFLIIAIVTCIYNLVVGSIWIG
jgi:hypothetical protein